MIKFFRRIRKRLLTENRFSKYLIYSIGEIILVVIGILIALSINNWNEKRKDQTKVKDYLQSIRVDLLQDLEEIESMSGVRKRIKCFSMAFPDFQVSEEIAKYQVDNSQCEITYKIMFNQNRSFRSNTSTFDAMVSEGSANLIANKKLFAKIQRLYTFWNPALLDFYNVQR